MRGFINIYIYILSMNEMKKTVIHPQKNCLNVGLSTQIQSRAITTRGLECNCAKYAYTKYQHVCQKSCTECYQILYSYSFLTLFYKGTGIMAALTSLCSQCSIRFRMWDFQGHYGWVEYSPFSVSDTTQKTLSLGRQTYNKVVSFIR